MLNAVIEIALGLIVLYSLLSLMCSKINELIAGILNLRARNLRKAIRHLVGDDYSVKIYEHPFITSLYRGDAKPTKSLKRLIQKPGPSYVPAEKFVLALLDNTCRTAVTAEPPLPPDPGDRLQYALAAQATDESSADAGSQLPPPTPERVDRQITEELERVSNPELKHALQTVWVAASKNVVAFRAGVEEWFNHTMDRASGWYKRTAQIMALVLGLLIAVALNVDTINVTQRLWSDGPLRSAVLEQVKKLPPPSTTVVPATTTTVAGQPPPTTPAGGPPTTVSVDIGTQVASIQDDLDQITGLQLPLGWETSQRPDNFWLALAGWIMTAVALSLGAPFWFDLLNKVTNLRSGGTKEMTPAQETKKPAKTGYS